MVFVEINVELWKNAYFPFWSSPVSIPWVFGILFCNKTCMFLKPPSLWELRMWAQVKCSHWKPFSASLAGLGICSSVFRANCSWFAKNERMRDSLKKISNELIRSLLVSDLSDSLMVAHFWWAAWVNRSNSLIFCEWPERFPHIAHQKRGNERFAHFLNRSRSLICHERPEGFAHGCSYVLSDQSELLTVAKWANERWLEDYESGRRYRLVPFPFLYGMWQHCQDTVTMFSGHFVVTPFRYRGLIIFC